MMMMDDQMSSDSSSTEFAPSTGAQHRTASLFVSLQSPEDPSGPPTQDASPHNDTLPSLQDRSWIGARMSPILLLNQDNDDNNTSRQHNVRMNNQQPQQQHKPLLQDDYYYARLQPPSSSQQQLPHHHQHHDINANPFFMGHHAQQQQQPPPNYAYPSAGHLRTEYPAFGIHPLQSEHSLRQMHADQQARQHQKQVWSSWGTLVCVVSGLSLLGMAVYDIVYYYHFAMDDNTNTNSNSHAWSLPWGQPTLSTGLVWGGLSPSVILTEDTAVDLSTTTNNANNFLQMWPVLHILSTYCRLVTSALQVHSVLEWGLVVLGWFVCQRPSRYPVTTTTTITVYTLSVLTGQLWMLAVWWIHGSGDNVSYKHATLLVAHCASWGTCGVLCFVGMVRPQRRFGCFMICIGLVVLSLLQALWILPANGGDDDDKNGSDNQIMVNNNDNSYYDYSSATEQRNAAFLPRNPLPLVIGCAVSSFVGWALYGSQMIGVVGMHQATTNSNIMKQHRGGGAQRAEQFSVGMLHKNIAASTQSSVSTSVRFFCAVAVVMAWIIPLLVLAYFDYYYYNHGDRHSNSSSSATIST